MIDASTVLAATQVIDIQRLGALGYGLAAIGPGIGIGLVFAAGSLFMVFFVFLLELLVGVLQAFIFTTLISTYISDSLEHGH